MLPQLIQGLVQAGQMLASFSQAAMPYVKLARAAQLGAQSANSYYRSLSPASKEKVNAIIRWGAKQVAMQVMMPGVLDAVGDQVMQLVGNRMVAEAAQQVVKRSVDVGIEAALKEMCG